MVVTAQLKESGHVSSPEDIDFEAVGRRLALLRKTAGMKQEEVAERLGCITRTVQNHEAGRSQWQYLDAYATVYETSKEYLLYGNQDDSERVRFRGDFPLELRDELANRHDEIMTELRAIKSALKARPKDE